MANNPGFKVQIPPEIIKFIDKAAPRDAKLLAAKGLVPMAPNILVTALFMLTLDADEEVKATSTKTLLGQPESLVQSLMAQPMHPKILDFYGRNHADKPALIEAILLNKLTPDDTFTFLAPQVNERLLLIIAENQERLLRSQPIAEALRKNPAAPKSVIDRVISFLRMNGMVLEGVSSELTRDEINQIMAEDDRLILQTICDDKQDESLDELSVQLFDESEEDDKPNTPEDDRQVLRKLSTLSVSHKIKLALKGNKEVRSALIKDPNKLVCTSVIKSPRIQEAEVASIASMRSVNDEVLRLIATNPEWTKNYNIKTTLVNNPKCPLPISMQFLKQMRPNELKVVAKNKNVSQQLQRAAKQLATNKRQ